ncbi:MAG: hypothetical protein A2V57_08735 [Candidatus Aminicenantes bacterium RBG_19FT_COMBO_65_30]|nr:MAG: hypothetical protein A2V57_08735 [Candidatus Aminicenantes bacterium RBG_19FT_COMBO_65_30]
MELRRVPISEVVPWDKNPRGILKADFERLKRQIKRLGVYKPLVVCEDGGKKGRRRLVVLGGNMRLLALRELGIKEIEVSVVRAPTDKERIDYSLSDNDRAGYYEEEALAELVYPHLQEINLEDFKVDLGKMVDLKDVVERYGPDIDDGADDVPEIDDTPAVTKTGDLFTLGKHRLSCGDSTKAEDVARLMRGKKADMVFTDPPYGVEIVSQQATSGVSNSAQRIAKRGGDLQNDNLTHDQLLVFLNKTFGLTLTATRPGAVWYVTAPHGLMGLAFSESLAGLNVWRHSLVWVKDSLVLGRADYHYRHEPIYYGWSPGEAHLSVVDRTQDSVWEFPRPKSSLEHPTMKPVELIERAVSNSSIDGNLILDPFLGSGTTLIAAEKMGRICYGMEIDPKYCDVIIKRYADYIGIPEKKIRATREKA